MTNTSLKALLIEDERPAANKLIRLLKAVAPDLEVVEVIPSVEKAVNWLVQHQAPDLLFMDVQLEDGVCFELFEQIKVTIPVIFTTAYDAYTLKAFKVNSVDYLLKPVDPEELQAALAKFRAYHQQNETMPTGQQTPGNGNQSVVQPFANQPSVIEAVASHFQPRPKERFLIKVGDHYKSIPTTSIHAFYIDERCTFLLTDTGRSYAVDGSLDKLEQQIDPRCFFRVNRTCIVHYNAIKDILAYSSSRLKLNLLHRPGMEEVLVSRERVADFKQWMDR